MTKPSCFRPFIKTGKCSKDDSGSQGCTVKKEEKKEKEKKKQPVNLNKKWLELMRFKPMELSHTPFKVADSFPTLAHAYADTLKTSTMYQNVIMTHATNDSTPKHKSRCNSSSQYLDPVLT